MSQVVQWLSDRYRRFRSGRTGVILDVVFSCCVLVVLFGLDCRDVYYKTQWLGPYDKFPFTMASIDPFQKDPLVLGVNRSTKESSLSHNTTYASGWGSYLESCQELRAVSSGVFFLQVLAINCSFGDKQPTSAARGPPRARYLFLVANTRPDAIAWASCSLLYIARRPPVCQSLLVKSFLKRYNMEMTSIPSHWMAAPETPGESELLALLAVISQSMSIHLLTCTSGFEFDFDNPVGSYTFHVFGCASADDHKSALAGHHVAYLGQVLADKHWLTLDDLNLLGFHFYIRQSNKALVTITQSDHQDRETLRLIHRTFVNFSSFGVLYVLSIVIDVVLLLLHLRTALELLGFLVLPLYAAKASKEEIQLFRSEDYSNFFLRPLQRSRPVVLLTLVGELLSWMIVLPNAIIWTWGLGPTGEFQALLSTMRFWILILIGVNAAWDLLAFTAESKAYAIARRTYLTPTELIVVGIVVFFNHRDVIFKIGSTKYPLEHQRLTDVETFRGMIAYGNAFDEQMESWMGTSPQILWIIFQPLVTVLCACLLVVTFYAALKMVFFHFYYFRPKAQELLRIQTVGLNDLTLAARDLRRSPSMIRTVFEALPGFRVNDTVPLDGPCVMPGGEYARLPLEELLNTPIRARSLVRGSLEMEITIGGQLYMRPPLYFDFGVYVHHEHMKIRAGFLDAVGAHTKLARQSNQRLQANTTGVIPQ